MEMKNKLYKHHKSKAQMFLRSFAVVSSFFLGVVALLAVPTYINIVNLNKTQKVEAEINYAKESEVEVEEDLLETVNNN